MDVDVTLEVGHNTNKSTFTTTIGHTKVLETLHLLYYFTIDLLPLFEFFLKQSNNVKII